MRILVVGGGAREHAIAERLSASASKPELFVAMKNANPGLVRLAKEHKLVAETDVAGVTEFAAEKHAELAIVGPEAPLEAGLVDALAGKGIFSASPSKAAARIETSKEFMRSLLAKHKVPGQVKHAVFETEPDARRFIEQMDVRVALKPIGLTGGKGVQVYGDHFTDVRGAMAYVSEVIGKKVGGEAKILVEEKLEGEEFTLQCLSDGSRVKPLPCVQDHKRLLEGDKGPNTGGMGSYSQADGLLPFVTAADREAALAVVQKIIEALKAEGCEYRGTIYGQFMLTREGPKIIEVNARFGDPEAMNVLSILESDFADLAAEMASGSLSNKKVASRPLATVCKYVVPQGYGGAKARAGVPIEVDEAAIRDEGGRVYFAAVNQGDKEGVVTTTGSRALGVVGFGKTIDEAEATCERALTHVKASDIYVRHDIGKADLVRRRVDHMRRVRGAA